MKPYQMKHWNLLRELTASQLKLKNQSTYFGLIWSFLNPLLMLSVVFIVFNFRLGDEIEHYSIYILIGIIHYTHFANSTTASMRVLVNMHQLTSQTIFPKELLVFSSVFSRTFEFAISLVLGVAIAVIAGVDIYWSVLLLPFVVILQVAFVLWVSLFLSWVFVFVKDIQHIFQVALRVLFFMTPIFYTLSFLGDNELARTVVMANPLTHLIAFARTIILHGNAFASQVYLGFLLLNIFLIYVALLVFKKVEPKFAEYL